MFLGRQQALSEAQRFPGILMASLPVRRPDVSGPMMYYEWAGRALVAR